MGPYLQYVRIGVSYDYNYLLESPFLLLFLSPIDPPISILPLTLSYFLEELSLTFHALANANEDATSITQNNGPATCSFYAADGSMITTTEGKTVAIEPPQPLVSGKCIS